MPDYQITKKESDQRTACLAMELVQDLVDEWGMGADLNNGTLATALMAHAAHLQSGTDGALVQSAGYREDLPQRKADTLRAFEAAKAKA